MISIDGHRILITHGHKYHVHMDRLGLAHMAALEKVDFVFYGHTHIARDENIKGVRLINPGSLRYSRRGEPSYAVLELEDEVAKLNIEARGF